MLSGGMKMTKFVECRIIDAEEPRPSAPPKQPQVDTVKRRRPTDKKGIVQKFVTDIYRTPLHGVNPLMSQLNTFA